MALILLICCIISFFIPFHLVFAWNDHIFKNKKVFEILRTVFIFVTGIFAAVLDLYARSCLIDEKNKEIQSK